MSISETAKENLAYGRDLVGSGIEGAKAACREVLAADETHDLVAVAARESWQAGAIGVMVGAICGVLADDRKPVRGVMAGALLGALLGYGGSFAWRTRPLTSAMARGAGKRLGALKDTHWLSKNPVPYG